MHKRKGYPQVRGLLHLLGLDHEASDEAKREMEIEEHLVLKVLGWTKKGLIKSVSDSSIPDGIFI